jgi:hypothetical protein
LIAPVKNKFIIGRTDIADFPKFGLSNVPVKIDSGAYTSTIHCCSITETNNVLEVVFLDKSKASYTGEVIHFREFSVKKVRSSSGQSQMRYIVKGNIELFGKKYNTEFTLSMRSKMRYPVLLGRKLLNKRFLIDTSISNQSYTLKRKIAE